MKNSRGERGVRGRARRERGGQEAALRLCTLCLILACEHKRLILCHEHLSLRGSPGHRGSTSRVPSPGRFGPQGSTGSECRAGLGSPAPPPCTPGNGPRLWRQWPRETSLSPPLSAAVSLQGMSGHPALGLRTLRLNYPLRGPSAPRSVSRDRWAGGSQSGEGGGSSLLMTSLDGSRSLGHPCIRSGLKDPPPSPASSSLSCPTTPTRKDRSSVSPLEGVGPCPTPSGFPSWH